MRRAVLALLAAAAAAACASAPDPATLSVVLVTLDTTRADRIGAYGGSAVPTPHLDRIAREGALVDPAVSQVPLTLPAHASILTGRYPASTGVRHNGIYRLPEGETTLAEALRDAGFDTAAFVSAYVLNRGFGTEQGFAVYDDVPVDRFRGGQDQLFRAERTAEATNARVFEWLERRDRSRRAFLWIHYYDPHDPYAPPESPGRPLQGEGYDREISYLDSCIGDLLARLEKDGILDNALLVVASDHGESLGEHGEKTHGLFLYEGAVRVPMLLRLPGTIPAGTRVAGPAELVDLAPTVLDLLERPPLPTAEGRSLAARARGEEGAGAEVAHAETLMPLLEFGWSELRMVRDRRFKYIQAPTPELYDLREDPGETRNLAALERERGGELAELLGAWEARTASAAPSASAAERALSPEEEAQLKSLGYLQGGAVHASAAGEGARPDPKERIGELRALDAAREALDRGDAASALAGADAVLAANPRNHQARTTRILALIAARRLPEAEREAVTALESAAADPSAGPVLLLKARGLLASVFRLQGRDAEAETQYRRMLEADPTHEEAAVDLARLLAETGRPEQARPLVDRVLAADPRNGMALAARLAIETRTGERAAALVTAGAMAEARAGDPPSLAQAAGLLMEAGRPAEAAACLEAALEVGELEPELLGRLGAARLAAGDLKGAREAFLGVSRLLPQNPRPLLHLGTVALREGREEEARARFEEALRLAPHWSAPRTVLGEWLAGQNRAAEAAEVLRDALRRDPGDARARELLARVGGA